MTKYSRWAAAHRRQAQVLITISYALLFTLIYYLGTLLLSEQMIVPHYVIISCMIGSAIIYAGHEIIHRYIYVRNWHFIRKTAGILLLSLSAFGLVGIVTQTPGSFPVFQNTSYAAFPVQQTTIKAAPVFQDQGPLDQKLHLPVGLKIGLISIVAIYIEILIVGFSCSLSCNGYPFWSLVVLVVGTIGVTVGLIYVIRHILGRIKDHTVGRYE